MLKSKRIKKMDEYGLVAQNAWNKCEEFDFNSNEWMHEMKKAYNAVSQIMDIYFAFPSFERKLRLHNFVLYIYGYCTLQHISRSKVKELKDFKLLTIDEMLEDYIECIDIFETIDPNYSDLGDTPSELISKANKQIRSWTRMKKSLHS